VRTCHPAAENTLFSLLGRRESPAFREASALAAAQREAQGDADTMKLLLELLGQPYSERRLALRDNRFHSLLLAAAVLREARRRPEDAQRLAYTACLILDQVGDQGRAVRVSAKVTLAEAQRRTGDLEQAEATLRSAQQDLLGLEHPWGRAELCRALGQLRWEQKRPEEAFALMERAGEWYWDLNAQHETAEIYLEEASWSEALGDVGQAAVCFGYALRSAADGEQQVAATRGFVPYLVSLGQPSLALDILHDVQRKGGSFTSAQVAALQSLEEQLQRDLRRNA
jgi:hypothetical protein